jgi:hypothetical protein
MNHAVVNENIFEPRMTRMYTDGVLRAAPPLIRVHPCHPWFKIFQFMGFRPRIAATDYWSGVNEQISQNLMRAGIETAATLDGGWFD